MVKRYVIWMLMFPVIGVFYIINSYTFFQNDDWSMRYMHSAEMQNTSYHYASDGDRINTLEEVFSTASQMYMEWGGGFIAYVHQCIFCGVLDSKQPFDIINTIVFVVFLLLSYLLIKRSCIQYTSVGVESFALFTLLFWFFAPVPNQTLYWVVGRSYLWSNTCMMLFLVIYLSSCEKDYELWKKIGLFILALYLGHRGLIESIAVCGSLVVFYAFNIHRFKDNAIPLSIGFGMGTLITILAPGNFARLQVDAVGTSPITIMAILKTFLSYKIFYLLLIALTIMWIIRRDDFRLFCKKNIIIFLALFWAIVAFSFVFRPSTRASFPVELLSLILLVSIVTHYLNKKVTLGIIAVLFIIFIWDAAKGINEAKDQFYKNAEVHQRIMNSDGNVCFDNIPHEHRMVRSIWFEPGAYQGIMCEYGLDSLFFYPLAYGEIVLENDQCTQENYRPNVHVNAYECKSSIILKFPKQQYNSKSLMCKVEYCKRKNISRELRSKMGLYRYEHYQINHIKPSYTMNDYDYYIVPPITNNYGDYISGVEIINN